MSGKTLTFGLLEAIDQRAIKDAISGETWAIDHLSKFTDDQRQLADLICDWYFGTTYTAAAHLPTTCNRCGLGLRFAWFTGPDGAVYCNHCFEIVSAPQQPR